MDIETIVILIQGTASLITIALFFIKPFRNWFIGTKARQDEVKKQEATVHESVKCLLRSEIVRIYYANRNECTIHSFEYENLSMLYHAYKDMHGNTFVDKIWEEIQEWEIIP